jgi:hypothetical protein
MQTFTINDFNHLYRDVLKLGDPKWKGPLSVGRAIKVVEYLTARSIFNWIYEDVIRIRSPFPTPIREAERVYEAGGSLGASALEAAKEIASMIPVIGGMMRYSYPGKTAWPIALATPVDAFNGIVKMAKNISAQKELNPRDAEAFLRLVGIPGGTQLTKYLSRRKQGFNVMDSLFGVRTDVSRGGGGMAPIVE